VTNLARGTARSALPAPSFGEEQAQLSEPPTSEQHRRQREVAPNARAAPRVYRPSLGRSDCAQGRGRRHRSAPSRRTRERCRGLRNDSCRDDEDSRFTQCAISAVPHPAPRLAAEGKANTQLVFGDGDNYLHPPDRRRGPYVSAIGRAQAADQSFPRVTIHNLRHTVASLAISVGANVKAVQRMLGHSSPAMTLDTYADLFDDELG
jgi:integrase